MRASALASRRAISIRQSSIQLSIAILDRLREEGAVHGALGIGHVICSSSREGERKLEALGVVAH
jgi:hypothetical protein